LGRTGQSIPILLMGGAMNLDQVFDPKLAEAFRFGVNYFDTADCYSGGTSETAVGNFLDRTRKRSQSWITTKSDDHNTIGIQAVLLKSLQKLKTDHVDMYFMHGLSNPNSLSPEMGKTADKMKKEGKIRFFGFSCHDSTVVELLTKASQIGYIDAVMFRYNFRSYGNKELNQAIDLCHKAGVGLIAMKTQGSSMSFDDKVKPFQAQNFTRAQAVLKAVWADERITAAISHMDTLEKLKENVAAALNKTRLADAEFQALEQYAQATKHLYCDGCQHLCGAAVPSGIQIGTTLRYLMYHDSYGERERARRLFAELPEDARRIEDIDYTRAAELCPNSIDIATHMQRAAQVLKA
ncbi:MAG TPA: aldo/keto reductase, partial [Acidobacteriota bacterium]|nr:aldo/keto reductase [Acidobacteriota bacterium]